MAQKKEELIMAEKKEVEEKISIIRIKEIEFGTSVRLGMDNNVYTSINVSRHPSLRMYYHLDSGLIYIIDTDHRLRDEKMRDRRYRTVSMANVKSFNPMDVPDEIKEALKEDMNKK